MRGNHARVRWLVAAVAVALTGVLPVSTAALAAGTPVAAARAWGAPQHLPGLDRLAPGGADVMSVSCAAPGDCAAGGWYSDAAGATQAFVVSEASRRWATAVELPGSAALNAGGNAVINSVSCPSPGNCVAGGYASPSVSPSGGGRIQAVVAAEVRGRWTSARILPGSAALNTGDYAEVNAVSCAAPGSCAAAGFYTDETEPPDGSSDVSVAFVATETHGVWGSVIPVPAAGAATAVSCPKAGDCVVVAGFPGGNAPVFVAAESNGHWRPAHAIPGVASGSGQVNALSCPAVGYCAAVGIVADNVTGDERPFVADEVKGAWRSELVPGYARLNVHPAAAGQSMTSVWCASPGNCSAGGTYAGVATPHDGSTGIFVVSETRGTWGKAARLPGTIDGADDQLTSVSCGTPGNCSAGGLTDRGQAFVADQARGSWRKAKVITSMHELNTVSCVRAGACLAGGSFGAIIPGGPGAVIAK